MIINLFIKHIKLNYIKQHSRVIDLAHHLLILKDYIKKKKKKSPKYEELFQVIAFQICGLKIIFCYLIRKVINALTSSILVGCRCGPMAKAKLGVGRSKSRDQTTGGRRAEGIGGTMLSVT
jgi:hypothetical protein